MQITPFPTLLWKRKGGFEPTVGCRCRLELAPKSPAYLTPPSVHTIFESFLAAGCPKPIGFPRKNGRQGVKPFGHGKSSIPRKRLKYSANAPADWRCVSNASSSSLRCFGLIRTSSDMTQIFREGTTKARRSSAPGGGRTHNLWLRRPTLYPVELRARTKPEISHRFRRFSQIISAKSSCSCS